MLCVFLTLHWHCAGRQGNSRHTMTTQVPYLYISFYACRQVQAKRGNGMHTMATQVPYLYISFYACIAFRQCYNITGNRLHRFQLSYESFYMGPKQITNTTPAVDPGGGGGGNGTPLSEKKLACLLFNYKQSSAGDLA